MSPVPFETYRFDARPDTADFRDRLFEPTLIEVPPRLPVERFRRARVRVLDQGPDGACTGFGLATVVHFLLRTRSVEPDRTRVSPWMLYDLARRYDEWPGEDYEGSSARGAVKGWHKHGVCAARLWPRRRSRGRLTAAIARDAGRRPLGAYYRVNHHDLAALHTALAEVGVLYATSWIHTGWYEPGADGVIPRRPDRVGGHAFAIVAYDERGFWVQNSWGPGWGQRGLALVTYDDWFENAMDVWVTRLGAPVALARRSVAAGLSAQGNLASGYAYADLRPHVVSVGNDGRLREGGTYGTSRAEVAEIVRTEIPRAMAGWGRKRLLLYAHGGLVDEKAAVQRVAEYRATLLGAEVYPLAFVWKTDFWTTVRNILDDALGRRRPEGFWDEAKDFLLDRLDDALEPLARALGGKAVWDEMKENAVRATTRREGAARWVGELVAGLIRAEPDLEIHLAGHSAGSIFLAPLVQWLTARGRIASGPMAGRTGLGLRVASCTLWAPACTVELFKACYLPALRDGGIGRFTLFTLTDEAEQDDHCANIYHKSLLYLVSNAFEARPRIPMVRDGEPILGMERFVADDPDLGRVLVRGESWILAPNTQPVGSADASRARHHGDFDDDEATVRATLARILDAPRTGAGLTFRRSAGGLRNRRPAV